MSRFVQIHLKNEDGSPEIGVNFPHRCIYKLKLCIWGKVWCYGANDITYNCTLDSDIAENNEKIYLLLLE